MNKYRLSLFSISLLLFNVLLLNLITSIDAAPLANAISNEEDIRSIINCTHNINYAQVDLSVINQSNLIISNLNGSEPLNNSTQTISAPLKLQGYHNLSEVETKLFAIEATYPNIAKVFDLSKLYPYTNGTPKQTVQGRSVYALKISDNPSVNESNEPDILYMSLHHSREWISVEVVLYFLDYILNNSVSNTTIANIINNTELWLVPVVNPDGFFHSQNVRQDHTKPNGNQWRKNCNESNGNPGFQDYGWAQGDGVDLNRNYGYKWAYDNSGSSPNANSPLYRGTSAFSEVETQLIRDLALARDFKLAISFHSYSQLIIFPWAYADLDTPHDALFNEIARNMSQYNSYTYGNPKDGTIYNCNGEACDWLYANQSCLAFTFELGKVFIPAENQILPICQKNLEPCILIAKIADDPYKIFNSGICGRVTTTQGEPLQGAKISTSNSVDNFSCNTNSTGHYQLRLPKGSYLVNAVKTGFDSLTFGVGVLQDRFSNTNFKLKDNVPPVVSDVWASVNSTVDDSIVIGSSVRIDVAEKDQEKNLTGSVEINSTKCSYASGKLELYFDNNSYTYYTHWFTTNLTPGDDYTVEAVLIDYDSNADVNGSNDHGSDLILKLVDRNAPIVSCVDSRVLSHSNIFGNDTDEDYELGCTVQILVSELFNEEGLNGTVRITSKNISYDSNYQELIFDNESKIYYYDWSTVGLLPSDDYFIETTLRDKWDNKDLDGLLNTPDLKINLVDTTAPKIIKVDTEVGMDHDEVYELHSRVKIMIKLLDFEPALSGHINISSSKIDYKASFTELKLDLKNQYYYYIWYTESLIVADDYVVEVVLGDVYNNYDNNGSNDNGPDIIIELEDTTPPEVLEVNSFVGFDDDNCYSLGEQITIVVFESKNELNLIGTIKIYSPSNRYKIESKVLTYDKKLKGYTWSWNSMGLEPANDYHVETTLSDSFGNCDFDGLFSSPDLLLSLEDTTAPEIISVWSHVKDDYDGVYESGSLVEIVVEERSAEPGLHGIIRIFSDKAGYDSGLAELLWNNNEKYYVFRWSTYGLTCSDDYFIETTLTDDALNSDSDGLIQTPDITLTLEDTTPPASVSDLQAKKDQSQPNKINLSWTNTETGSIIQIYRTTKFSNDHSNWIHIGNKIGSNFTDIINTGPGKYYYLVLISDPHGNFDTRITSFNSVPVTIPPDVLTNEDDDHSTSRPFEKDNMDFKLVWLVGVVIIILVLLVMIYYIRNRKLVFNKH